MTMDPVEPPPQPVPPLGPEPAPPKSPQPFPRPVERRAGTAGQGPGRACLPPASPRRPPARAACVLLVLASSLGLAGCPFDKVQEPKASAVHVPA